ncbi:MAG TPA: hypothetical protein VKC57_01335 [Ktedonobacterales bacterium]|nr:hypothetical protein [Ktedonobacterales bacterium]
MIERLARALEHVEQLPPEVQEELAEQIELYRRVPEPQTPGSMPGRRSFAGIWWDLPDDMEETLLRWRHEATPTPPVEDQLRWAEEA